MSFSKYIIEKKQVSLDMGVTWQDAAPSETRNGRLLGTYRTLVECEDVDCDLEKWGIQLVDEKVPSIVCTHTTTIASSTLYDTYLPSGIAKSVTFVAGMKCCRDYWGSSDNIIKDEYHNSSMTAKTATITTGWNPIREYNSYVLDGREMTSGTFCGEPTCYNITEFMPWIDPNGTIKMAYKVHYVREHCSDEWKIDEKYAPQFITFGERWVKTYEDIYKTTWQHQIATDISYYYTDSGWMFAWVGENEGEPFDYEYEVSIPQDVQIIEYLRADGVAANASGWTDFYQMKVKIDPTNLGNPTGCLANRWGGSQDTLNCTWSWWYNEGTPYYVEPSCTTPMIEITPNEWKSISIDVVAMAKYAGFFCQVYVRDSSPIVNGSILDKAYVGGLIQIDGNMYFPYKVPSSNGWEDEYLNASEYGFIDRTGNKVVLEYVYGKYTNTYGVTKNLSINASNKLEVPSNAVDVVFADSVTSLPIGLCSGNTVLTSVTMNRVISVGGYAFDGCTALKSIDIPSTVTEIGDSAFRGCTSLTGITFGSGLTKIIVRTFSGCTSLTDVVIPSNISDINIEAFGHCTSLTSLTLGEGVSRIEPGAFLGCNIKYLTIRTAKPPILYKKDEDKVGSVFTFADDAVIFVPCEAVDTYKNSINWQSASSMIHPIPNEYRWVSDGYVCIDGMKYLREKKQGRNVACADDTWHDVGETRFRGGVIKCGYEEIAYLYRDDSHKGFIPDLGVTLKDDTKIEIKLRPTKAGGGMIIGEVNAPNDNDDYRFFWANDVIYYDYGSDRVYSRLAINTDYVFEVGNYYIKNLTTGRYILQGNAKSGVATAHTRTLGLFGKESDYAWIYYIKVYEGNTLVKDFIPAKSEDGSVTLYDKVSKTPCSVNNGTFGAPTE